jgi:hypothetical protein
MENFLANSSDSLKHSEPLKLLTAREAARYLRVSISTLNRIERRGMLNPLRIPGGHRRYTVGILNDCLQRGDIEADVKDLEIA